MTETTNVWSTPTNEVTVTIKAGKGYEDSWYVFRGDAEAVKEQLIGFFALDRASVASLSPFETAVNARQIAQSISDVSAKLGAVAIGSVPSGPSANAEAAALGTARPTTRGLRPTSPSATRSTGASRLPRPRTS